MTAPKQAFTVIANFHNMRREAERTLYTLTPAYQRRMNPSEYEVVAVDNGSTEPLDAGRVESFGSNFRHVFHAPGSPSPAAALNQVIDAATSDWVVCLVDGARMLSPGILDGVRAARRLDPATFAYTIGMHIGNATQNELAAQGYTTADEDALLEGLDWRANGYRLFEISTFAPSSRRGFLAPVAESNCFAFSRQTLLGMGGFNERFCSPGGGLLNLELFERLVERASSRVVALLGEATFHQFHGGVATNVPQHEHPWRQFAAEYERIVGRSYRMPQYAPLYLGRMSPEALAAQRAVCNTSAD